MIEKAPKIKIDDVVYFSKALLSLSENFNKGVFFRIDSDYLYWDKIKYLKAEKLNSNEIWDLTKMKRFFIEDGIKFNKGGSTIWLKYNLNKYLSSKLHNLDFNFGAGLQKEQLLSELEKQQYLKNALMEESIFSSMIEGATTTRVKAKEMLRKSKKPKNKSEQMILNNYKTIQYISENQEEEMSKERLFEIHRLVTENTLEDENVGVFRCNNEINVVNELTGEIVHIPPSFDELDELMNSFCDFFNYNPKEDFIHPIVKASIMHFLIGYIHPFVDGNGRTARAIFYWYLLKNGYWLTEYLSISRIIMQTKVQYEKAYLYTEIDEMDVTYFIHYQVKVLIKAFEDLKKYIAKKKKDEDKLSKFLQLDGVNERQAEILFKLEQKPNKSFTVKEIENIFGVTNQTARADIEELVQKKLLRKVPINKKSYNYWKGEGFDGIL